MTAAENDFDSLRFDADGLIPAVIQDAESAAVLMVGFMNAEALRLTRETGRTHFWSRSRRKLWRKGETSGHEQIVHDIYVNCELNTLLVAVTQIGAVCHDGYPTCFYRRFDDAGRLEVVRDRTFDPATVYGPASVDPVASSRIWFRAYEYLRDRDLAAASSTSRRLQPDAPPVDGRIAAELRELAGVLDGTHRHRRLRDDVILEGSQVLYWVVVAAVRDGVTWEQLRPDDAVSPPGVPLSRDAVAELLRGSAALWDGSAANDRVSHLRATVALVGQACRSADIAPIELTEFDLRDLRTKPYLAPYFASIESTAP